MIYVKQDYRDRQDYLELISGDTVASASWSIAPNASLSGQVDTENSTKIFVSGLQAGTQYILTVQITGASGSTYTRDATINSADGQLPPISSWQRIGNSANAALVRLRGEVVTYQWAGGVADPVNLTVIWYDNEMQMPQGVRAKMWILESDLSVKVTKGDLIQRGDFTYKVVDPPNGLTAERDGTGGITLCLRQIGHAQNS